MFISKHEPFYQQLYGEGDFICVHARGAEHQFRTRGLYCFAADCLAVFEQYPHAQGIRLVCRLQLGDLATTDNDLALRLVHQVEIQTQGFPYTGLRTPEGEWRCRQLPYALLGEGQCTVRRDSGLVQQYLALPGNCAAAYRSLVHTLAERVTQQVAYVYCEDTEHVELIVA